MSETEILKNAQDVLYMLIKPLLVKKNPTPITKRQIRAAVDSICQLQFMICEEEILPFRMRFDERLHPYVEK